MIGFPGFGRSNASGAPTGAARRGEAEQVLTALRHRRLHRRRARDRLPAYLVVGPPGMGKSAMLERSGLRLDPPLELASSNWWIGEDALFVEVPQHETAPDGSHPVLPLLRALRPRAPVSGIILVVSPADMTLADIAERVEISDTLTRFVRAFETRFGYAPPLYVVVSKLDLTPGFEEFFDRLEPAEREQPWGFTLPVGLGRGGAPAARPAPPPPHRFPESGEHDRAGEDRDRGESAAAEAGPEGVSAAYRTGFRRLLDVIRARITQWITPETDPVQCARIVGFGAQISALETILSPIVEPLMPADDRHWQGAWLRGVYLTSTQQNALAIDALLPDLAKRFGLPRTGNRPPDLRRDDETLGYFVGGLFRRVILPEAGLAQLGHRGTRLAAIRGWSLVAGAVAACLGLGLACTLSYEEGVARIAGVDARVPEIGQALSSTDPAALPEVLTGLDGLEALRGPGAAAFPPPVVSLDRYAQALIAREGEGLYAQATADSLGPRLGYRLAQALVRFQGPPDELRLALAAAVADRTDGSGAYRRWLGTATGGLPIPTRPSFVRHGEQALRLGAAPAVEAVYPQAARAALTARDEGR